MAPNEWVAAYNLGMIEERLARRRRGAQTISKRLLSLGIPDSRHRLASAYLYLWRIHQRKNQSVHWREKRWSALKREKAGLEEWQVIMGADEAQALRDVLRDDVDEARRLIMGEEAHVPQ